MSNLKIANDLMHKHNVECTYNSKFEEVYCIRGISDAVRINIDLKEKVLSVEIFRNDSEIDTIVFNDLENAFKCMEFYAKYYKYIQDTLNTI